MSTTWALKDSMPDLTGKVAIVTGGNAGIGKEVVRSLALNNAKVYMASRSEERALGTIADIRQANPEIDSKPGIHFLQLDLTNLKACQSAAREFLQKESRLDILVNNAGIAGVPYQLTKNGIEFQFQTNHLGHFAFTYPLLPLLVKTSKDPNTSVRIVQVSSYGHNFAPKDQKFDTVETINRDLGGGMARYGQSKLANILFAKALSKRFSNERIWSSAVHPGSVDTNIWEGVFSSGLLRWLKPFAGLFALFYVTPEEGAKTVLYAAAAQDIEKNNYRGEYFIPPTERTNPSAMAQDETLANELWEFSERLVKEKCGNLE